MTVLEPRDTPTTFLPQFADGVPADLRAPVEAAFATASDHLNVPGVSEYPVAVGVDPRTPVLAYATYWAGENRGAVWLGPAVRGYDVETIALHELAHAAGVRGHSDSRADVLFHGVAVGEVKRAYTAGDDELFRAAGLVVAERVPTAPVLPDEVYPYTESHPYRGPLVRVAAPWGDGWVLVPPRVAAEWGIT